MKKTCQSKNVTYKTGSIACRIRDCSHKTYKTSASGLCSCCCSVAFHKVEPYGFKKINQDLLDKVEVLKNV